MKEIKVIKSSVFKDHRGYLWTSWENKKIKLNFNHDKFSISKKKYIKRVTWR